MFKKLEYIGFDGHPDLLALAEGATPLLADEVRTWRDEVEVSWEAAPDPSPTRGVYLELRLKLPTSTGIVRRLLTVSDFADERRARAACRSIWGRLLDKHLEQHRERLREYLTEPVEA